MLLCLSVPVGLEDVSKYPYLFAELIRRNYSDEEVKQVAGMNLISVFQQVEQVRMWQQQQALPLHGSQSFHFSLLPSLGQR